jgi:hypothetical protein
MKKTSKLPRQKHESLASKYPPIIQEKRDSNTIFIKRKERKRWWAHDILLAKRSIHI